MNRTCALIAVALGSAVLFATAPALRAGADAADERIDALVRQAESKARIPMHGVKECYGVEIRWLEVPDKGPEGPRVDFEVSNHTEHTIAVRFGYRLTSTLGQVRDVDEWRGVGSGHINAGPAYARLSTGAGIFPNSIADNGDHPQLLKVEVGPVTVAPNIDVPPAGMPDGSYNDTWRDYKDLRRCGRS